MPDGVSCPLTLAGVLNFVSFASDPLAATHYPNRQCTPSAYRDRKTAAIPLDPWSVLIPQGGRPYCH